MTPKRDTQRPAPGAQAGEAEFATDGARPRPQPAVAPLPEPETRGREDEEAAPPPKGASPGSEAAAQAEAPADTEAASETEAGADVGADLDELVSVAAQRDEYLALAQRTQADFENYRKRMAREVSAAEARGATRLAKELLPALDSLQRALSAAESPTKGNGPASDEHLAEGIRLVHSELLSALSRLGIESYLPEGEQFDPNQHEAMAQRPAEGKEPGTVLEVYQAGYRLGDTVIRPARVVVAG